MIDLSHSKIHVRGDGILQMDCHEHLFTLENIHEINQAQRELNPGKKSLLLVVAHPYANVESEAREFMATQANAQHYAAQAYVLRSLAQKILANFYLNVNKPPVPTRFFSNKVDAISWLKSFPAD